MPKLCVEGVPLASVERAVDEEVFDRLHGDALAVRAHRGVRFADAKQMLVEANMP